MLSPCVSDESRAEYHVVRTPGFLGNDELDAAIARAVQQLVVDAREVAAAVERRDVGLRDLQVELRSRRKIDLCLQHLRIRDLGAAYADEGELGVGCNSRPPERVAIRGIGVWRKRVAGKFGRRRARGFLAQRDEALALQEIDRGQIA